MQCSFISKVVSGLCSVMVLFVMSVTSAHAVFINEIHYDNVGGDVGEGIELAGVAGLDLAGWSLVMYNGGASSLSPYATVALGGVFTDMQNGFGVLDFSIAGIQNGGPDGFALVDATNSVIQFLSYEGSFTAISGSAAGLTSIDIGVSEGTSTSVGQSLQLVGSGQDYADFSWAVTPMMASFGGINAGQSFSSPARRSVLPVPEPASGYLLLFSLLLMPALKKTQKTIGHYVSLRGSVSA